MGTNTVINETKVPAWMEAAGQSVINRASDIGKQPYIRYGGKVPNYAAQQTPAQGQQVPTYNPIDGSVIYSSQAQAPATGGTPDYLQVDPSQFQYWDSGPVADLNGEENWGRGLIESGAGSWKPGYDEGTSAIRAAGKGYDGATSYGASMVDGLPQVSVNRWNSQQADAYMNPYLEKVQDMKTRRLTNARDAALRDQELKKAVTGNWGGARHGLAGTGTQMAYAQQIDDSQTQGYNDAWNQAISAFGADEGRSLDAQKSNQDVSMRAKLANAAAKNQASEFGINKTTDQFNADKNRGLQVGQSLIDAAGGASQLNLNDADSLIAAGGLARGIDQKKRDFDVDEYRRLQDKPYKDTNLLTSAISGSAAAAPTSSTQTGNTGGGSTFGKILGTGLSLASLFKI